MSDVTRILESLQRGEAGAENQLLQVVYAELHRMAVARMAAEPPGQTIQATVLVHEAWLRLNTGAPDLWQNRAHFFSAAAEAMRRILVDRARRKKAARHGGGLQRARLTGLELPGPGDEDHLLAVHDALEKFAAVDPAKAELVKLRYFAGLTMPETMQVLNISERTAHRWWSYARAWFQEEISRQQP